MKNLQYAPFAEIPILVQMKGGADMPSDDFYIICPYYHKAKGNNLFCNGFSGDESFLTDECYNKQVFKNRKERNSFIKKYCSKFDYLTCGIAALNEHLQNRK